MAENGPFGNPLFDPKNTQKSLWGPFLRPFPGNEAHKLFLGAQKSKKFMLIKFMCLSGPL